MPLVHAERIQLLCTQAQYIRMGSIQTVSWGDIGRQRGPKKLKTERGQGQYAAILTEQANRGFTICIMNNGTRVTGNPVDISKFSYRQFTMQRFRIIL